VEDARHVLASRCALMRLSCPDCALISKKAHHVVWRRGEERDLAGCGKCETRLGACRLSLRRRAGVDETLYPKLTRSLLQTARYTW